MSPPISDHDAATPRRVADLRFVLPSAPAAATVLGPPGGLAQALSDAGTTIVTEGRPTDLVVAPAALAARAGATGAPHLLLCGPITPARVRALGYVGQRLLVLPSAARPELVVPLDRRDVALEVVRQRVAGAPARRRWRAVAGVHLAGVGAGRLLASSLVTVAARRPGLPFPLAAARAFGVPADASWCARLGRGDDLQRIVFLAFAPGSARPSWAVKVARVPGLHAPFDRDERGLALIADAGPALATHAPRLLGRTECAGLAVSVETAAPGERLVDRLRSGGREARASVDAVAAWLVELARATAGSADALHEERERLVHEVGPSWRGRAPIAEWVSSLPSIAPVLQHNDLGSWNLVADGTDFTAVDWESATAAGLPLWDLLYFLADASAQIAGEAGPGRWSEHVAALFRGEAELSAVAFAWIRRAVKATSVPEDAVGRIAALGWLHHGASHVARASSVQALVGTARLPRPEIAALAERWLDDPALGPTWSRWQ